MFHLEKVLGLTVDSNRGLATNSKSDLIAYTAGSTIVLMNISTNNERHIINQSRKPIRSLAFSECGKFLILCEHGQNSAVKIWSVQGDLRQIGEITPDENGSRCVAISPDGNCLVTLGFNSTVSLWDWKSKNKLIGSKVNAEIVAISFEEHGAYFVTVGKKHVKYWYFLDLTLSRKSAAISDIRDVEFCGVACGKGKSNGCTYVVTKNGAVYMFNSKRSLQTFIELETSVNCLVTSERFGFVGCKEGTILCFDSLTLKILYALPKCHSLGLDVDDEVSLHQGGEGDSNAKYPDTNALAYNEVTNSIISIYNDHSLYFWDLQRGYGTVTKHQSFLYHSNCIWDVKMETVNDQEIFITCSSDNTIRIWNANNSKPEKIIYVDKNCNYLKDIPAERTHNGEYGMRCMAISSDKVDFACGDRQGNIRIFKLPMMDLSLEIGEYEKEVLALDYTPLKSSYNLLASGGQDKRIFVFDVNKNYDIIQKIEDHTSSVTTVKFGVTETDHLILVTSSSDGYCSIRTIKSSDGAISFTNIYSLSLKRVLYTFELDKDVKYLLLACQSLKILDISSREIIKTLRPLSKGGFIFKITSDPSNKYICASCLDKSIIVYDFSSGNCLSTLYSNLVTSLCFTHDCRRLIAVTGDGCIFIWKVVEENRLDSFNEDLLPIWVKKYSSEKTNIVLSEKSIVPKGKWADRMKRSISIKAAYVSDESEGSPSTPLSAHSDIRYFSESSERHEEEIVPSPKVMAQFPVEASVGPPPTPPKRKNRKNNATNSTSSDSFDVTNDKEEMTKVTGSNEESKIATNVDVINKNLQKINKASISSEGSKLASPTRLVQNAAKRAKASQMIGEVKQKLDDIGQLRSSKSMFDLSQPPPAKGTWLVSYRASVGEQKNQLRKGKSMSNLGNLKLNSAERSNQVESDVESKKRENLKLLNDNQYRKIPQNSTNRRKLSVAKSHTTIDSEVVLRKKPTKTENKVGKLKTEAINRTQHNIDKHPVKTIPRSPKFFPNPKLSLLKPQPFSRTQTDPEIVFRKKAKDESNLAKLNQQLSASNRELNRRVSIQDVNVSTARITEELCESVASELVNTATKAVVLYRRFIDSNNPTSSDINALENLALSLVWAQIKLQRLNVKSKS